MYNKHNRHSTIFTRYRSRYKQTLPVLDHLFSLIGLDTNKHHRSSTILSALPNSIQMYVTGPRQSFQPFRIRYKRSLPVFDNLFSLIGLDTNMPYQSSTIFSVLPDSIQTTLIGLRQSFKSYRTRYRQTLPVLDNLFSLIGLDTNKQMDASMNASMNAVPGEREKCSVRCSRV